MINEEELILGTRSAFFPSSLWSRNTPGKLMLLQSVEPGGENALSLVHPLQQV